MPMIAIAAAFLMTAATAQGQVDPEEQLDGALRLSGYTAGMALQCTAEAEKAKLESEVLARSSEITRLLGSDRAFYYSAAFGAGSTATLDRKQCPNYLKSFAEERKQAWSGKQN